MRARSSGSSSSRLGKRSADRVGGPMKRSTTRNAGRLPAHADARAGDGADLLDMYIAELSRTPVRSAVDQKALARRWRDIKLSAEERETARAELIRANLRFAFSVAKQYQHRGVALEDLVSEANAGLLRAADKYDPDVGVNFISYAVWWIRQALSSAVTKQGHAVRVPLGRATDVSRIARAQHVLREKLGRDPSDLEVAQIAELDVDLVRSIRALSQPTHSFDEPVSRRRGEPSRLTLADVLAVNQQEDTGFAPSLEQESRRAALESVMDLLAPRERRVLMMYYGLEGNEPMTLKQIGKVFGVSRERVRQLRERALARLRTEKARVLAKESAA
jgi:RNA polymerase primary sigma factor